MPGKVFAALISVVLSLNLLLMPIDASTEEMDNAKNKAKDLLTNIFNTFFSETREKFSNSKYGVDIQYPKNWTGIEMNIVPMALLSPAGFNFSEIFSTIADDAVRDISASIAANETDDESEQRKQEFIESFSNNLTQEFENMTSTMGILIHDKEVARLVTIFNPNSTIPVDSLTSIFERLMLASDSSTICERKTLEIITINNNINAEKSTQECSLTDSDVKHNNLNYFVLTPESIVGIIFSSDSSNLDKKDLRDFEDAVKTLSVKESLPINNETIQQFLDDGTKNNTDSLLNETAQNFMDNFNGNELLSQGKYEEAIKMFDLTLSVVSNDVDALYHKGVALANLGKNDEAISYYDKALAVDPKHADALFSKGVTLGKLGKIEEAITWFDKALAVDPNNVDALIKKGAVSLDLGKKQDALELLDKALTMDPTNKIALDLKSYLQK
jgi:tetratricopeptide (TPR) repeat protein